MADIEKTRKLQYKIMQDIAAGASIPLTSCILYISSTASLVSIKRIQTIFFS